MQVENNIDTIKVLHLIETIEPGGAESILVDIASSLSEKYHSIGCVFESGWTSDALEKKSISVVYMPLKKRFDIGWAFRLRDYIISRDIGLLHSHEFTMNCYAVLAAKLAKIPVVCTVHGKDYYPYKLYRRIAYRLAAIGSDAFVAVSDNLKSFLVENIKINRNKISTIYNGIDVAKFSRSETSRNEVRKKLYISDSDIVCIVVAALFDVKGHDILIDAFSKIDSNNNRIKLLIVGEGFLEQKLKKKVESQGLNERIQFLGFRSDIKELLSASDIFILPSLSEGLPVSVIEAMAAGLPVIATDVGGTKEVLQDGVTGMLVESNNVTQLYDSIISMTKDKKMREEMGRKGLLRASSHFNKSMMIKKYEDLYQHCMGKNSQ